MAAEPVGLALAARLWLLRFGLVISRTWSSGSVGYWVTQRHSEAIAV